MITGVKDSFMPRNDFIPDMQGITGISSTNSFLKGKISISFIVAYYAHLWLSSITTDSKKNHKISPKES
jgi:hypothetical protein